MQAVWNFLLLGLPGGVMMALDAASFDITTVMAGFLGERWRCCWAVSISSSFLYFCCAKKAQPTFC